jgi:mycothiol synthase
VLEVRITPPDAAAHLRDDGALARLVSGDSLDQAMFGSALLGSVVRAATEAGAEAVELAVTGAGDVHDAMAAANGFILRREILRLGRELPVGEPSSLAVRPFRAGADDDAWLAVNNRAFAWHPDQGGWTRADLASRLAEPWFDPAGFLVHEEDGRLAGFCWTKVHAQERPPLGEIFVIAVDPDFAGRGLGRGLVLAGLDHLAGRGLRDAILYVESTNAAARHLYDDLGFAVTATDRWWRRDLHP